MNIIYVVYRKSADVQAFVADLEADLAAIELHYEAFITQLSLQNDSELESNFQTPLDKRNELW